VQTTSKHNYSKHSVLFWCLGDKSDHHEYFNHAILLTIALLNLISGVFNYFYQHAEMYVVLSKFIISTLMVFAWYISRWHEKYRSGSLALVILTMSAVIPINWFGNGGSSGPTYFMILAILFYFSFAFRETKWLRAIVHAVVILYAITLIWIEHTQPHLVYHYPTEVARSVDLTIGFIFASFYFVWMLSVYAERFKAERNKAHSFSARLKDMAERDPLTGLQNRLVLEKEIRSHIQSEEPFSLALIDIDRFKAINDNFGHNYGDHVLCAFSELLKDTAKSYAGLGIRQGGEEFILFISGTIDPTFNATVELLNRLASANLEHGPISFSAGVVEWDDREDQITLLKRADDLMYAAKEQGRNRVLKE
jgi:diguanylate cyclase (GGDEF) domain